MERKIRLMGHHLDLCRSAKENINNIPYLGTNKGVSLTKIETSARQMIIPMAFACILY